MEHYFLQSTSSFTTLCTGMVKNGVPWMGLIWYIRTFCFTSCLIVAYLYRLFGSCLHGIARKYVGATQCQIRFMKNHVHSSIKERTPPFPRQTTTHKPYKKQKQTHTHTHIHIHIHTHTHKRQDTRCPSLRTGAGAFYILPTHPVSNLITDTLTA